MRKHKVRIELPYKKLPMSGPVAENVEAATNVFSGGTNSTSTGKYEMIIVAAKRAIDLACGSKALVDGTHKPAVTALLEIEAGLISKEYLSTTTKKV